MNKSYLCILYALPRGLYTENYGKTWLTKVVQGVAHCPWTVLFIYAGIYFDERIEFSLDREHASFEKVVFSKE